VEDSVEEIHGVDRDHYESYLYSKYHVMVQSSQNEPWNLVSHFHLCPIDLFIDQVSLVDSP